MTTFTAWKFDSPDQAQRAAGVLKIAAGEGLVTILDVATVSWPKESSKPEVHHGHEEQWRGTGWGAFWGLLFGAVFFVPLLGAAAGAALGAIGKAVEAVGIGDDQIQRLRDAVVPGTSLLAAVTQDGDLDRLAERFSMRHATLVTTNLTEAERSALMEAFA